MRATAKKASNQSAVYGLLPYTVTTTDARTRIRQRIRRLLEDRGKTNRALGQHLGHGDQWVSNLLAGRFALSLDELDRVAEFLRVPPSEIVRLSDDAWELSPSEMRAIRALRMLPRHISDHEVEHLDYLIGATPEQSDHLVVVRGLTEKNQRKVARWAEVLYRQQVLELDNEDLPDPAVTIERPVARSPRIRGGRSTRRKSR